MLQAIAAGSVDVGGVGNAPPVFAAAGGDQLAIVGALQANPTVPRCWYPRAPQYMTSQQLQGQADRRRPGQLGRLSPAHRADQGRAQRARRHAGLPAARRRAGRAQLRPRGRLGHLVPVLEEGETLDGATAIVTGQGYGSPYSFTVASRAALADPAKAAAIRDYLALIAQAHRWANNHLSAWAAVWAKASGLPLTVMTHAASDDSSFAIPITPAVIASEQQVSNAFTASGPHPRPRELQPVSSTPRSTPPPEPRHDQPRHTKQLHFNAFLMSCGHHEAAWRLRRATRSPNRPRSLDQARATGRTRHVRLGLPRRRPGAVGQRRAPPGAARSSRPCCSPRWPG